MYDLFGDIHGHADDLVQLFETLGYREAQGVYRYPERKTVPPTPSWLAKCR